LPDEAKGLDAGTTIGALSLAAKLADQEVKLASSGSVGGDLPADVSELLAELPRLVIDESEAPPEGETGMASRVDFAVLGEIGRGGMGVVQSARQRVLGRRVALKRVRPDKRRGRSIASLLDEARIGGALDHPAIVPVHTLGLDEAGDPVLVMKQIEGVLWRELIDDSNHPHWQRINSEPLPWHLEILMSVCHAVELAHSRGIVHRDLKPDNVMIGDFGEVYVLDWGLALPTGTPSGGVGGGIRVAGTPAYMAPEMVNQKPITEQTDVYLLGSVLHFLLTGRTRHQGASFFDLIGKIHRSSPVCFDDDVPAELGAICNKAVSREPADRFGSVADFRQAIAAALQHRGSEQLADEAEKRLASYHVLIELDQPDPLERRRLATECRFAFRQALQMWTESERARRGLDRALELLIDLEIEQGNEAAARALLAEMPSPDERLQERVEELAERLEAERARVQRLTDIAHAQDASVLQRDRALQLLALTTLAMIICVVVILARRLVGYQLTYQLLLPLSLLPPLLVGGLLSFSRVRRMRNLVNRKLVWALLAMTCTPVVVRWLAYRAQLPVEQALLFELAAAASGAVITSLFVDKRLLMPAGLSVVCTIVAGLLPELVVELTVLGTVGALIWVAFMWLAPSVARGARGGSVEEVPVRGDPSHD